ncbi:MAG: hypothetical protein FWC24_06905, partial [Treponema sp.]|nr:hypothetical protein [Treponema sp.]
GPLHAQESEDEDEPDYIESDWDGYMPSLYSRGDQTFTISLGVIFPALFYNEGVYVKNHNFTPPVGGMGVLGYTYFINSNYFLGGEIGLKFNYTLGQNTIFMIPIGLRTGWQFIISRFEIPLHVTAGIAPQRYLNNSYVGLFVKGGGSLYFRFSPDWSFGLNADWSWYPQWPRENGKPIPQKNMDGHIVGLTLSARYHF